LIFSTDFGGLAGWNTVEISPDVAKVLAVQLLRWCQDWREHVGQHYCGFWPAMLLAQACSESTVEIAPDASPTASPALEVVSFNDSAPLTNPNPVLIAGTATLVAPMALSRRGATCFATRQLAPAHIRSR
jgi:hypothetical protein